MAEEKERDAEEGVEDVEEDVEEEADEVRKMVMVVLSTRQKMIRKPLELKQMRTMEINLIGKGIL